MSARDEIHAVLLRFGLAPDDYLDAFARELAEKQGDRLTIGGKTYEVEEYEWVDYAETSSNYSVWVKRDEPE